MPQHDVIGGVVISAPTQFELRNAIRETWGKLIKPLFIMGLHDQKTFEAVASEAETHDDIILEDFIDSYANLTIKAAYAFKHYLKYYEGSKYFLKADDDIFLNVENLYSLLEGAPANKLIGKVAPHNVPIRDISNKWYIPEFLYPINLFPPYLYGFAVIIPG